MGEVMTDQATERVARVYCTRYSAGGCKNICQACKDDAVAAIAAHIADIIEHGPSPEMRAALADAGLGVVPRKTLCAAHNALAHVDEWPTAHETWRAEVAEAVTAIAEVLK